MTSDASEPSLYTSRAARVTLVMAWLYAVAGVVLAFLPRWLEVERDLNGAQIGAVLSLAQFGRIVTSTLIAHWADNAADRAQPIKLVSVAALFAYAAFFLLADGFWALLLIGFVALSLTQATTPLIEAALLRATQAGRLSYGVTRAVGSIAFIAANVAGGFLIMQFGVGAVVIWTLCCLTGMAISAVTSVQPDPITALTPETPRTRSVSTLLRNRRFVIIIIACGLIQSAHAFYYGFSVLVWRAQDISAGAVGVLWAFGVAVEVVFLLTLPFWEKRLSPQALILIGAVGSIARWVAMGFAPTGLILWPLQAMHAVSFAATHVGAMRLLFRETPEHSAAMGQTLYSALSGGVLMGASTLLSGALYDLIGAHAYWAMAAIAGAGGALALLLLDGPKRSALATSR